MLGHGQSAKGGTEPVQERSNWRETNGQMEGRGESSQGRTTYFEGREHLVARPDWGFGSFQGLSVWVSTQIQYAPGLTRRPSRQMSDPEDPRGH